MLERIATESYVILSGVWPARSAGHTESKDPCTLAGFRGESRRSPSAAES